MTTAKQKRRTAADWFIVLGAVLGVLVLLGTLALTTSLTLNNNKLLTEDHTLTLQIHSLTVQNHILADNSKRNHEDNLIIEGDLSAFCKTYHVTCQSVQAK